MRACQLYAEEFLSPLRLKQSCKRFDARQVANTPGDAIATSVPLHATRRPSGSIHDLPTAESLGAQPWSLATDTDLNDTTPLFGPI